MALALDQNILDLLLQAAFLVSSISIRTRHMVSYYDYITLWKQGPFPLWRSLKGIAKRQQSAITTGSNQPPSAPHTGEPDYISALPNELLERVMKFVFSEKVGLHDIKDIHVLRVSNKFLGVGIRAIFAYETFVFSSAQADQSGYVVWPAGVGNPLQPDWRINREIFPQTSNFVQLGVSGVLRLDLYSKSPLRCLPDPIILLRNLRLCFTIPPVRIHRRWNNQATAAFVQGTADAKMTHPYIPQHASDRAMLRWMEPELTDSKASYHLGIIVELPFKNLHLLQLSFNSFKFDYSEPDCDTAVARWIGRYLHRIAVTKLAKRVTIIAMVPAWRNIIEEGMVNGFGPWVGNL